MSIDYEILEQFKEELADRYTAVELVDLLNLDVWDIIESFQDQIIGLKFR